MTDTPNVEDEVLAAMLAAKLPSGADLEDALEYADIVELVREACAAYKNYDRREIEARGISVEEFRQFLTKKGRGNDRAE